MKQWYPQYEIQNPMDFFNTKRTAQIWGQVYSYETKYKCNFQSSVPCVNL